MKLLKGYHPVKIFFLLKFYYSKRILSMNPLLEQNNSIFKYLDHCLFNSLALYLKVAALFYNHFILF